MKVFAWNSEDEVTIGLLTDDVHHDTTMIGTRATEYLVAS